MEILIDKVPFQSALCVKDNNLYIYKIDKAVCPDKEDYIIVKCFRVTGGKTNFSKAIEIYGKDLVILD